ncbi:hydrolase [Deltaproteobacteria bacterium]|nr:hydrolase [Deltaproteobacteria bacterium]
MSRLPSPAEQALKAATRGVWEADRAALLFERPFLATLALRMALVPVVDHRVPTAATDGDSIWFNPSFLSSLSPADRSFVLAHEIWHCVMLHPLRRGDRDPRLWNLAADHEVNALLGRDGFKLPEGAVYFRQFDGCTAEEVYAHLPEERLGRLRPLDTHLEPCAMGHRIVGEGVGSPNDRGAAEACEDPDFALRAHRRETWEAWPGRVGILRAQMSARGLLSGAEEAGLSRAGASQIDWRRVLQNFVTRVVGGERVWSPPSRRHIHRGLYLPSFRDRHIEACVAVDTSGSTHAILPAFLAELHGLLTTFGRWRIRLLWADAEVQREEIWTSDEPVNFDSVRVPLGGGTDFRPVFTHLTTMEPPQLLVYLTDGCGPAPASPPAWPVLWVIPEGCGEPPVPWGEVATFRVGHERR